MATTTFSILERIVVCATKRRRSKNQDAALSVSSNGSWCVQHQAPAGMAMPIPVLSVSSNGSWCVQPESPGLPLSKTPPFQYPRTDRGVCNAHLALRERERESFQYPRTDRGVCNKKELQLEVRKLATFSILERIVVCATSYSYSLMIPSSTSFSILERIVVCATTLFGLSCRGWAGLSVSSNGSWCVQR